MLRRRCKDMGAAAVCLAQLPWGLNLLSPGFFLEARQSSLEATGSSEDVTGSPERFHTFLTPCRTASAPFRAESLVEVSSLPHPVGTFLCSVCQWE